MKNWKWLSVLTLASMSQFACSKTQIQRTSNPPQNEIVVSNTDSVNLLVQYIKSEGIQDIPKVTLATIPHGLINGTTYSAYGTFQSHYQKVVSNKNGIFAAFLSKYVVNELDSRNDLGTWQVVRSEDGGQTFKTIYSLTTSSKAPCLETDNDGNIYLAHAMNRWEDMTFSKLLYSENFEKPHSVLVLGAGAGKYSCAFNESEKQFLYLGWSKFVRIDTNSMNVIDHRQFFSSGPDGHPQYPHLVFEPEQKTLLAAWTTVSVNEINGRSNYLDARYAISRDNGLSWKSPSNGSNLNLPIVVDDTGGAPTALLATDLSDAKSSQQQGVALENWLDSVAFIGDYFYFAYINTGLDHSNYSTRYTRTSLRSDETMTPVALEKFKGETIELNSNGLYFTTQTLPGIGSVLYAVGATENFEIASLYSFDKGVTWHDHAIGEREVHQPYAITGSKHLTSDGYIIGEYTSYPLAGESEGKVKFFKIKGRI